MFSSLDASNFNGSVPFYEKKFEEILGKITMCYELMKSDEVILENDENKIRDVLIDRYVNNPKIKRKIKLNYFLFPEVPETETSGRTDIRIHDPNSFYDQKEYYIIECKRLDSKTREGNSGLNAKYIKNGIARFTSKKYSSYHRVNGMIGFIVDDMEIHDNIEKINTLLSTSFGSIKTTEKMVKDDFIKDFEYHYHSIHENIDNEKLKLYHLMFDFARNI